MYYKKKKCDCEYPDITFVQDKVICRYWNPCYKEFIYAIKTIFYCVKHGYSMGKEREETNPETKKRPIPTDEWRKKEKQRLSTEKEQWQEECKKKGVTYHKW